MEQHHSRSTRLGNQKGGARQYYCPQDQGPDLQETHNALSEDHACRNNKSLEGIGIARRADGPLDQGCTLEGDVGELTIGAGQIAGAEMDCRQGNKKEGNHDQCPGRTRVCQ